MRWPTWKLIIDAHPSAWSAFISGLDRWAADKGVLAVLVNLDTQSIGYRTIATLNAVAAIDGPDVGKWIDDKPRVRGLLSQYVSADCIANVEVKDIGQ